MTQYAENGKCDEMLAGFLKQFGLPTVLHTMSGGQEVPADLWAKIEAYQKKGYSAQFDTV